MVAHYRFSWVDPDDPASGGQWAVVDDGGWMATSLGEAVIAHRHGELEVDPLEVHVEAMSTVLEAAGALEDEVLPVSVDRLDRTLAASDTGEPEVDPASPEGLRLARAADALEKLASDVAEMVEEQLDDDGSLAKLPPRTTHALCLAVQSAWRLRSRMAPPGPLVL